MSFLTEDSSGTLTAQITRLLRDPAADNIPLLLEMIEGGGVNRRITGYLFGIAVFHYSKVVADKAFGLLRRHAGQATVLQAQKLKEGAAYHYNETEYIGKYRNPEFDIFDFILANKMCTWHRQAAQKSHYATISHYTLNLTNYPDHQLSEAVSTLDFIKYIIMPAHRQFDIYSAIPLLKDMPLETVHLENISLPTFPTGLLSFPSLKSLTIKKGNFRPKEPVLVSYSPESIGSSSLEKLEMDGYTIANVNGLGPFPALKEVDITRCGIEDIAFLAASLQVSRLNLRGNLLKSLPVFLGRFESLAWMDLSANPFEEIVLDLSAMQQLKHLEIKL